MNQLNAQAPGPELLDARAAAELLGVQPRTLYAYVSRGLLRSVPGEGRARRYPRVDVERLLRRKAARRDAGAAAAAGALRWGEPVFDSAVTEVTPAGPRYRGRPAVELAGADAPFEAVAELLWTGDLPDPAPRWSADGFGVDARRLAALLPARPTPLAALAALVPLLAAGDPGRFDRRPDAVLERARRLVRRLAAGLALGAGEPARVERALAAPTVAHAVAAALGVARRRANVRALDRALTLWADHELNASSFAARVAASAEADPYSCVAAGLATLAGPLHGAHVEQVEALAAEARRPADAAAVVHARRRRGEAIPGFGHPLYPGGDPRAAPLLAAARELAPRSRRLAVVEALVAAVAGDGEGPPPTVDVGTVALAGALGLERGAAPGLIAVGRAAGWVAHVLEQYAAGFLIRPRARYRTPE